MLKKLRRRGVAAINIGNVIISLRHFPADWKKFMAKTIKGSTVTPELSVHQPPAILGTSVGNHHFQEARGARTGPTRHSRRPIRILENPIDGTSNSEDDRIHHSKVQQERSDRSRSARCLQGLRQSLAQRITDQRKIFEGSGKNNQIFFNFLVKIDIAYSSHRKMEAGTPFFFRSP